VGFVTYLKERSGALLHAVARFPGVVVMLLVLAAVTTSNIAREVSGTRLVLSLVVAAFFALASHSLLEKEGRDLLKRLLVTPAAVLAGVAFYFIGLMGAGTRQLGIGQQKFMIRTWLVCSILFLLFLAIQCLRNKVVFGTVFMSVFKAFFTALLFSGVIFGGLSLILAAIDNLQILRIDPKTYSYAAVWVWILVAPVIFLSLLMTYHKDENSIERDKKISSCPVFFRVLLLYVIIPLLIVYTMVFLIYLLKTLVTGTGQELLRPLIMSYSIAVIFVYFLVSEIENRLASFFRLVFPKIMAVIALYQVIVSVMDATKQGVDFSEYFIILISVYAVTTGVMMSVFPVQKNVIHILVLCGFAVFALLPFVNFYSVGVASQKSVMISVLDRNDMLGNGEIISNSSISEKDQILITRTYNFLLSLGELDKINGIDTPIQSADFTKLFGFDPEYGYGGMNYSGAPTVFVVNMNQSFAIDGSDYLIPEYFIEVETGKDSSNVLAEFNHDGAIYRISASSGEGYYNFVISDSSNADVLTAPFLDFIDGLRSVEGSEKESELPLEQMTYQYTEGNMSITVYIKSIQLYPDDTSNLSFSFEPIILVDFA
jgi:hypothetical protein